MSGFVRAGFFVVDRVDVGGQFGANYSDFDGGHSYSFSLGPAVNYHFRPATDIVPFVGGGVGYMRGQAESTRGDATATQTGWYAEAHAGADFFVNRYVAIKLSLQYGKSETDQESKDFTGSRERSGEIESVSTVVGLAFFFK